MAPPPVSLLLPGPQGRLAVRRQGDRLDGTSHWPHLDRPGAFNRRLGRFLRALEA